MSALGLNLARRPFVNRRPVRRLAVLLWLVGGVLLAANSLLYWRYFSGQGERGEQLENLVSDIDGERNAIARLERELAALDLEWQNGQVEFLNEKIDQRVFSWSSLFDDLAAVLPPEVQLNRVAPRRAQTSSQRRIRSARASSAAGGPDRAVELRLAGGAKDGESLLALVDALFEHPRFRNPNLSRESKVDDGSTGFTMSVVYLPAHATRSPAADGGAAEVPKTTAEGAAG